VLPRHLCVCVGRGGGVRLSQDTPHSPPPPRTCPPPGGVYDAYAYKAHACRRLGFGPSRIGPPRAAHMLLHVQAHRAPGLRAARGVSVAARWRRRVTGGGGGGGEGQVTLATESEETLTRILDHVQRANRLPSVTDTAGPGAAATASASAGSAGGGGSGSGAGAAAAFAALEAAYARYVQKVRAARRGGAGGNGRGPGGMRAGRLGCDGLQGVCARGTNARCCQSKRDAGRGRGRLGRGWCCTHARTHTHTRAHTHTYSHTTRKHTHARTHARTHTHTRARAHRHTQTRVDTHTCGQARAGLVLLRSPSCPRLVPARSFLAPSQRRSPSFALLPPPSEEADPAGGAGGGGDGEEGQTAAGEVAATPAERGLEVDVAKGEPARPGARARSCRSRLRRRWCVRAANSASPAHRVRGRSPPP
jgi:hypothetical protein